MNFIFVLIFLIFSSPSFAQRYPPGGGVTPNSCTSGQFAEAIDASGILTCSTPSGGGGSPGGSNEDLQYNNSGAFGGSDALTWDGTIFNANGVNIDGSQTGDPTPELYDTAGFFALNGDGSARFGNGGSPPVIQWDSSGNFAASGTASFAFGLLTVDSSGTITAQQYDLPSGGNFADNGSGGIEANVSNFYVNGNFIIDNGGTFNADSGNFSSDGSGNVTAASFLASTGGFSGDGSNLTSVPVSIGTPVGAGVTNSLLFVDGSNQLDGNSSLTTDGTGTLIGPNWSISSADGHAEFDGGLVSTSGTGAITASIFNGGSFSGDGSGLSNIPITSLNVTVSGDTTELASVSGVLTSGHTVLIDSSGNFVDAGIAPFASPMSTLGDIIYENATPTAARLAGNTTTTKKFLQQTGTGSASAPPIWGQPAFTDITGTATIAQAGTNNGSLVVTLGTIYYGDGTKLVGLANGTTGQYLGANTSAAPSWKAGSFTPVAPTIQRFTSGSGTYTLPTPAPLYIKVRILGGGGGGSGGGTGAGTAAGAGSNSTFGNLTAGGGAAGTFNSGGVAGGAITVGSGWTNLASAVGNGSFAPIQSSTLDLAPGSSAGGGALQGQAAQGAYNQASAAGSANTGNGGQGGGGNSLSGSPGTGGGNGAFIEAINSGTPSSTYSYSIGGGGTAGGAGTAGLAGGAGGSGIIIVEEFYQ